MDLSNVLLLLLRKLLTVAYLKASLLRAALDDVTYPVVRVVRVCRLEHARRDGSTVSVVDVQHAVLDETRHLIVTGQDPDDGRLPNDMYTIANLQYTGGRNER